MKEGVASEGGRAARRRERGDTRRRHERGREVGVSERSGRAEAELEFELECEWARAQRNVRFRRIGEAPLGGPERRLGGGRLDTVRVVGVRA